MLNRDDAAHPPERRLSRGQLRGPIAHLLRTASYEQQLRRPGHPQSRDLSNELQNTAATQRIGERYGGLRDIQTPQMDNRRPTTHRGYEGFFKQAAVVVFVERVDAIADRFTIFCWQFAEFLSLSDDHDA